MKTSHRLLVAHAAVLAIGIGAIGCDKDKGIRSYKAPPDAEATTQTEGSPANIAAADLGFPGDLRWTLPAGWKQVALPAEHNPMSPEVAAIAVGTQKESPLTLTVSRMPAGQSLSANITRWAGQLQISPPAESDLGKVVTQVQAAGAMAQVVDLKNDAAGREMLGALVSHGQDTWIFKLMGSASAVQAEKGRFESFVRSLRFSDGVMPPDASAGASAGAANAGPSAASASQAADHGVAGATWTLPAGWTAQPSDNAFRLATIHAGGEQTIIKVSRLGSVGGGLSANVNRWRGEVGLPPVDEAQADPGQQRDLGKLHWTIHDYTGPAQGGTRLIVASAPGADGVWFFKMSGPTAAVAAQKANFDAFLASVRF